MTCTPIPDDVITRGLKNEEVETATEAGFEDSFTQLIDPDTGRLSESVSERQPCPLCGEQQETALLARQGFAFVRCGNCGQIYMSPRLNDEVYEKRLRIDQDLRDNLHAALSQNDPDHHDRIWRAHLVRLRTSVPRGKLLDIGSGLGGFLNLARGAGYVVAGVEIHQFAASHARSQGFMVYDEPLERLHLPPGSVDIVTVFDFLGRSQRPRLLLQEIRRVLKPHGRLLLTCPNVESLSCQILGLGAWELLKPPDQINWFSRSTLVRMLRQAKFQVDISCQANGDLEQLRLQLEANQKTVHPFFHRLLWGDNEELRRDLGSIMRRHNLGSWLVADCTPA